MKVSLAIVMVCLFVFLCAGVSPAQNVTSVEARVAPQGHNGPCPAVFEAKGVIESTHGTVRYRWERSDNSHSAVMTYVFHGRERKIVTHIWRLSKPTTVTYHGWMRLHVISPVSMESAPAHFELHCR